MTKGEEAAACFGAGFNCAQAVLAAFADDFDLDRETALRLAGAFGGGIARSGQTCGAVTGGLMALGLAYGQSTAGDAGARNRCYAGAQQLRARFQAAHGSLLCRELLGYDLSTPEGQAVHAQGTSRALCACFVQNAAETVERLLPDFGEDA